MPSQSWTLMAKLVTQIYSKPDAGESFFVFISFSLKLLVCWASI